jgi:succinyl-CoA synthetase alpha subunit
MSILIDKETRVLIQGITGGQASSDLKGSLDYGVRIVAGVTPGKGGESVHGIPVYDTVRRAVAEHTVDASVLYVPPLLTKDAVIEAIEAGLKLLLVTAEYVPVHDISYIMSAARSAGVRLIGCNTNGIISPGKSRLGGIGGPLPDEIYAPGSIGVCSRSGGMTAEISLALKEAGLGISTCVSMGGDAVTGLRMADYMTLFEDDPDTEGIVIFGEPGTKHEQDVAELVRTGRVKKPVVALISGVFQEQYSKGRSFGHAAAMIADDTDTATVKKQILAEANVMVAALVEEIPTLLAEKGIVAGD